MPKLHAYINSKKLISKSFRTDEETLRESYEFENNIYCCN